MNELNLTREEKLKLWKAEAQKLIESTLLEIQHEQAGSVSGVRGVFDFIVSGLRETDDEINKQWPVPDSFDKYRHLAFYLQRGLGDENTIIFLTRLLKFLLSFTTQSQNKNKSE
jgi:hypothetical protein